jgi:hypothetical protein
MIDAYEAMKRGYRWIPTPLYYQKREKQIREKFPLGCAVECVRGFSWLRGHKGIVYDYEGDRINVMVLNPRRYMYDFCPEDLELLQLDLRIKPDSPGGFKLVENA